MRHARLGFGFSSISGNDMSTESVLIVWAHSFAARIIIPDVHTLFPWIGLSFSNLAEFWVAYHFDPMRARPSGIPYWGNRFTAIPGRERGVGMLYLETGLVIWQGFP